MHTPPSRPETVPSDQTVQQVAQQALQHYQGQPGNLLPILHAIQDTLGYIPAKAVPVLAEALQLSRAEIHGVISFYAHLRDKPAGKVVLEICRAEACQAMGGEHLAEHARQQLGCDFHATSSDGQVTLEPVYCLGLCAQSPSVMVDGQPYARMTPAKLDQLLRDKGV
ncbi:formate dehydrogenase subunit gamma [Paralcaligenes sp. KSB-10]|jgi:formate dehydrogenase subunit gamma|uniref:formate dehydrogenase subunit gamma n=1 Tax=Paralcaligenes sp. KSB-10 TaxID=2901142 RepID=UPI001E53DB72|nr:formate dehydrogenase subunit gamma [Paralcaligenes sp. KSB-10]UHL62642.1 formate dehydrogenase subunit gamma [Paralcaligenes sp. KSB-10]